jgi:hypothetical protein
MQSQNNMQAPSVAGMMGLPNAPAAGSTPAFRQGEGVQPTTPMTFDQFFQRGQANDTYLGRQTVGAGRYLGAIQRIRTRKSAR